MLHPRELLNRVERAGAGASTYAAQRAYVAFMFDLIGRLLVAASRSDPEIQQEIQGYREGFTIGFSVMGEPGIKFVVGVKDGYFERRPKNIHPELEIVFKHVSLAFYVLTFKESTARAYANERFLTHGDIALALRFVRCMNRMQAVALPRFVANHALKGFPDITPPEKRNLVTHLYGHLVRGFVSRS